MKATKATLVRSLDHPDAAIRLYLFHGADEAGSRVLADRLLKGLGAEKFVIAGQAVKGDPALLADEAASMGLFGDRRAIWIEPAGDDIVLGTETLLGTAAIENPVIALAGALKKTSGLLKLAETSGVAFSHCSYPLEGRDADRLVVDCGRNEGLRIGSDVATRVAALAANNSAVIASELAKFALYLGATPERPRDLDNETIDKLGADTNEGNALRIGDLALQGKLEALVDELQRLAPGGSDIVPIIRSLQRRILQVAPLRARIEAGERADAVLASLGKALFWRDKPLVQRIVSQWSGPRLAQLADRVTALERRLMLSPVPGEAALGEELLTIARAARR